MANTPSTINTPLKKPTKNKELGKIVGRLFNGLQIDNPNKINDLVDFYKQIEYSGVDKGLLSYLEEKQAEKGEFIEFIHIQDEIIPLDDEVLHSITENLNDPSLATFGPQINAVIVKLVTKGIENQITTMLGATVAPAKIAILTTEIAGITNLKTLKDKIQYFIANDDDLKSKNIRDKIKITNGDIKAELIAGGTITATDLDGPSKAHGTYPGRTKEVKDGMDVLLSLELEKPLKQNIAKISEIITGMNGVFSNSFPMMSCVLQQFPFNTKELIKPNSPLYPQLEQCQHDYRRINTNPVYSQTEKNQKIQQVQEEMDLLYRQAYLEEIRVQGEVNLADALQEIGEKKFNFKTGGIDPLKIQYFFDRITTHPYNNLQDITEIFNIKGADRIRFTNLYADFLDINKHTIDLPRGISLHVNKSLCDLNQSPTDLYQKDSSLHTIPIEYELDLKDFDQFEVSDKIAIHHLLQDRDIKIDGDKITIKGNQIGRLIYLFFLDKDTDTTAITGLSKDTEQNLQTVLEETKTDAETLQAELNGPETLNKKEQFMEEWNKIKGYPFKDENNGFTVGTSLVVPVGDTQIPPKEHGGKERIQIEITDIKDSDPRDPTFTVEIHGIGSPANGPDEKFEGKSRTLKMTKSQLETLGKFGNIYKLPKTENDPIKHLAEFKKANDNGMGFKGIDAFDSLERDKDHFIKDFTGEGEKEPVEYFGYQDTMYDKKGGPHKENIMYAVKYNPGKKTFTLTGEFNDYTKDNPKTKEPPCTYTLDESHEMDYNAFMMFISEKNLKPRKKESAEQLVEEQKQENMKLYNLKDFKINRHSLKSIIGGIKAKRKQLQDKIEERTKAQQKQFEDWLVDDLGIWNLVDGALGRIPGIGDATGNLQWERYNERDKEVFAKIEKWLKFFEADPDFGTTFPETPPHVRRIFHGKSYKQFLLDGDVFDKKNNTFISMKPLKGDDLHKGAALLLANISKGKGMYRGLSEYENSGLRVAKLLGQKHRQNFMRRKKELMAEIDSNKRDSDRLREQLSRCEVDYILNNIRGSNPYPNTRFGAIESRGEAPDGKPEYIDNPSKIRLSNAFADKLDDAYKNRNTQSNIDSIVQTLPNDFGIAKSEFESKLKSGRFPIAMANLKKMHTLMRTDEEKRIVEGCVIAVLLSGEMNSYPDKKTIRRFGTLQKTAGLIPGFAIKHADHPKRVLHLLNKATGGKFGAELRIGDDKKPYNPADYGPGSHKVAIADLTKAINARWSRENASKAHDFFDGDLRNKSREDDSILKDFQDTLFSTDTDLTDNEMLENDDGINLQGINASKNVAKHRMGYRNGEFDGKDADEKSARETFRKRVNSEVSSDKVSVEVAMRKFLGWFEERGFQENEKEKIVQAIKTAKQYKNQASIKNRTLKDSDGTEYNIGKLGANDRKDMLRYTFKGKVIQGGTGQPPTVFDNALNGFLKKFEDNIDEIANDDFISKVFGSQYTGAKALKFVGRDRYNTIIGKNDQDYLVESMENMQENNTNDAKKRANAERKRHRTFFTKAAQGIINTDMRHIEKAIERYYTAKPTLSPKEDLEHYEEIR